MCTKKTGNAELAEANVSSSKDGGRALFSNLVPLGLRMARLGRGYKKLTKEEQQIVREKLDDFRKSL